MTNYGTPRPPLPTPTDPQPRPTPDPWDPNRRITIADVPNMVGLLQFRDRFDACLAEVGENAPHHMALSAAGELTIDTWPNGDWPPAATRALELTAHTFRPAARLLETMLTQ